MIDTFINSPRDIRRLITIVVDAIIGVFSAWFAFSLRLDTFVALNSEWWPLFVAIIPLTTGIFIRMGLYRSLIRNFSLYAIRGIAFATVLVVFLWGIFALTLGIEGFPRSVILIMWLILFVLTFLSRFIMHALLMIRQNNQAIYNVAIYGVDVNSHKIVDLLTKDSMYKPIFFISDDSSQHNTKLDNLKIYPEKDFPQLIENHNIKCIFLNEEFDHDFRKRRKIFDFLRLRPIKVITCPHNARKISNIQLLKDLTIEELMQRNEVKPNIALLEKGAKLRNVMVTGAGGSIGSILCQHIMDCNPQRLVMLEQAEYALFEVCKTLSRNYSDKEDVIHSYLGSVTDKALLDDLIKKHDIDIIYHAAAYKHVPLVESNIIAGIYNNIIGTRTIAQSAAENKVKHFVLISTDKAVNPTNIMGMTKRVTEKLMQMLARKKPDTCFCAVRFGNVLGSSGSVVPILREQIEKGLPLTITHPDVERYFMSIDEAVDLVIQAGAMAKSGDIFLLDMGKPIKILDIAERMIHLSGLHIKKDKNDMNTVDICYTGLRPGEKLSEKLFFGVDPVATNHPKIMLLNETTPQTEDLESLMARLDKLTEQRNATSALETLEEMIVSFGDPHPQTSTE